MNDNKKFWQRYAPFYAAFMEKGGGGKVYDEIGRRIRPYLTKETRLLELACGSGQMTFRLCDKVNDYIATDFSEEMIRQAQKHPCPASLRLEVQDATALPYADGRFDAVLIANALHIIPLPDQAMAEIRRVLQPGGYLFAPTCVHGEGIAFRLRMKLIETFGFKAYMKPTAEEFARYIASFGFEVLEQPVIGGSISPLCCLIARRTADPRGENL